jgi:hypothetical protein
MSLAVLGYVAMITAFTWGVRGVKELLLLLLLPLLSLSLFSLSLLSLSLLSLSLLWLSLLSLLPQPPLLSLSLRLLGPCIRLATPSMAAVLGSTG